MQSLTPREAQVREFVDRLENAHEFEFEVIPAGSAGRTSIPQAVMPQAEICETIIRLGIGAFLRGLSAASWPDLDTMTPDELEAFKAHAVAWFLQS